MADEQKPGGPAGSPPPKIHVDSDWKKEAQAEKERLARQIEGGAAKAAAAGAAGAAAGAGPGVPPGAAPAGAPGAHGHAEHERRLPPASFATLVQTLATQAAIFMSEQPHPETGEPVQHLELAKHNIDLLRVLEEKTKGNLTGEESHLLEGVLYDLLMAYVSAAG